MEPGIPISPDKIDEARKKRLAPEVIDKINDILIKRYSKVKPITIDYDEICQIFNSDHEVIDHAHLYIKAYFREYGWDVMKAYDTECYSLIFTNLLVSIFK